MTTIEKSVKAQFSKIFGMNNWVIFKKLAESNLEDATKVKGKDLPIERQFRLLARNSRKRLLLGVGVELLLKSIYLKQGYVINKAKGKSPKFPFRIEHVSATSLCADNTYQLDLLIRHLQNILNLTEPDIIIRGLTIAKVFRNKEGHSVTCFHEFDPSNYKDIANSLVELYRDAFGEALSMTISMVPRRKRFLSCGKLHHSQQDALAAGLLSGGFVTNSCPICPSPRSGFKPNVNPQSPISYCRPRSTRDRAGA